MPTNTSWRAAAGRHGLVKGQLGDDRAEIRRPRIELSMTFPAADSGESPVRHGAGPGCWGSRDVPSAP